MDSITTKQCNKPEINRPKGASCCDAVQPCGRLSLKNFSRFLPFIKKDTYIDCRYIIIQAIKKGLLQKPEFCSFCGNGDVKINAHHEDYTKPLEVIWLCNRCHIRVYHHSKPFAPDLPKPKRDTTEKSQFIINGKNCYVPVLKDEPCKLGGLLVENDIQDDHKYFEESYNWNEFISKLSYREREIIKLRYGIDNEFDYTLEEVGRIFKVSRERVRQVEAKAIRKLRKYIVNDR